MNKSAPVVLAVLIVAGAVAGYYYYRQQGQEPPPAPTLAVTPPAPPPAAPAAEPQILHPIESPAETAPLPSIEQSDAAMLDSLRDLLGNKALALLMSDRIIHRIVATVDALPRRQVPMAVRPVKPVPGSFLTAGKEGDLTIAPGNAARYDAFAALARSVDARKLVDVYRHYYPLFQRAYRELGYPKGYFNDRLIEAIDDLLDAPEPAGPVRLVQPKVLYQFADANLESRSAGQKIMIRMGVENAKIVKAKLREIRQVLTGGAAR
jgi:hypothetical protein